MNDVIEYKKTNNLLGKCITEEMFESEFAKTEYIEKDNVVSLFFFRN